MRLIETHNLRVEEAILTGESTVVDKITDALEGDLPLGDRVNMVFSGTTVSAGGGVGVVTATGAQTELGHINQMMAGIEKHRTPLLVQMDKLRQSDFRHYSRHDGGAVYLQPRAAGYPDGRAAAVAD